jgi:PAS domain S-box-containing protein
MKNLQARLESFLRLPFHALHSESYRSYVVFNVGLVAAFLIHISLLPVFAFFGVYPIVWFNLISLTAYGGGLWLIRRGWFLLTAVIATSELIFHQSLVVYTIGWEAGFQYYILSMTAIVFFVPPGQTIRKILVLGSAALGFVLIGRILAPMPPVYTIAPDVLKLMHDINIVVVFLLLGLFASYYTQAAARAENKLSRRLNLALRSANVGLWEWSIGSNEMFLSPEWKRQIGFEPGELPDRFETFEKRLHPEDRDRVLDKLTDCVTGLTPDLRDEFRLQHKDGSYRWILSQGKGQRSRNGRITHLHGCHLDISDRKSMESRMLMHQKSESIGTLAGGIAHDFNNILSAMIGYTELSLEEVEKGSVIEKYLQEIYAAGNRARDLVKQILAFARQSKEETKPLKVDIIIREVVKFIRASIPSTIRIEQEIESRSLILGNPSQVHQILMNLCTNAAHAMEDRGGVLKVAMRDITLGERSKPEGLDLPGGDYVEIQVSDTGRGIAPDIIHSIFEPYFTTKGQGEGTGLGLATVQGIVRSYGGRILVDSTPDRGTTFSVYLPVTEKRGTQAPYEPERLPRGTERVLFVDDEAPIAELGRQALERLGYSVTTRYSSVDALALFRSRPHQFDLVITDMTMPNMTGDRLAVELMKIRPDIPVVVCTGFSKQISEVTAKEIGIKALAYKPMVRSDLAKIARRALDRGETSSANH